MRHSNSVSLPVLLGTLTLLATAAFADEQLLGFDMAGSDVQHGLEAEFDSHIDSAQMLAWLREFSRATARAHCAWQSV